MLLVALLSMLAAMCGAIATSAVHSLRAPVQLFPKRHAEAISIPKLLPQPESQPRLVPRAEQAFGGVWQGDEKKNRTHSLHEEQNDDVGTYSPLVYTFKAFHVSLIC
jgi:hypothetical protein